MWNLVLDSWWDRNSVAEYWHSPRWMNFSVQSASTRNFLIYRWFAPIPDGRKEQWAATALRCAELPENSSSGYLANFRSKNSQPIRWCSYRLGHLFRVIMSELLLLIESEIHSRRPSSTGPSLSPSYYMVQKYRQSWHAIRLGEKSYANDFWFITHWHFDPALKLFDKVSTGGSSGR